MSNDYLLYEKMDMMNQNLPIIFHKDYLSNNSGKNYFKCHWHETIEFLYFIKGEGIIRCNSVDYSVKKGDLIVVNSNELHQGVCVSESMEYYCIIFDTALFQSRHVDICEAKYINPISQNSILFKNKVENNKEVAKYIKEFVREYNKKDIGYEMAIKAAIYRLLVLLLRNHVQVILTSKEYNSRLNNLNRFNGILEYIENHYNEKITIDQLCVMTNISRFHFCRVFKSITGKPLGEYLNALRINKAEVILMNENLNITEAALVCGFDDMNYFSRLFKKYKKVSPSSVIKRIKE